MTESILDHVVPCGICDGKGEYKQTYTAGCGGGYYKAYGPCDYCKGMKWRYKSNYEPVPQSVLNQIEEYLKPMKVLKGEDI